jgi:hypothetical protein
MVNKYNTSKVGSASKILRFLTKISELHVKVLTAGGQSQDVDRLLVIMVK